MARPIHEIASEVYRDWKKINYAASPYLLAMLELDTIDQVYGFDSAKGIVIYFLSNAKGWRGPKAKLIKEELKALIS